MRQLRAEIAVIGGGTGGFAAALAAARTGRTVVLTEATHWLGGQLTAQAVPPDEHPWIEEHGCTASYRRFRDGVRRYYRAHLPLSEAARADQRLNPGLGQVSRLCCDPRVALAVLEQMLAPYVLCGRVRVLRRHVPLSVDVAVDWVRGVSLRDLETGDDVQVEARYVLDATELGDLLPMAGAEHVIGAESRRQTGEPHAPDEADPLDQQGFTVCFALEHRPGEEHLIERPETYDFWRAYRPDFWPDALLGLTACDPKSLAPRRHVLFPEAPGQFSLWTYRRIQAAHQFDSPLFQTDVSLINWPQNDYWLGPLVGVDDAAARDHLHAAGQLSRSLLYWLQTECPRPDGGAGYPGLKLRPDVTGTADGLALSPYVREARRIAAEFTVLEQHIASAVRPDGPERFADSVGIGCYRIDLHPSTAGRNYIDIGCWPFQIPLGALIPVRMENLLPAAKNLGVTHITNGCYRLHPVEWNIGEAAGLLAAFCLEHGLLPRQVRAQPARLAAFQERLVGQGVELEWPAVRPV
ncbi:MAG TPA: FAD-dependent oxidoreductase [Limnochordia bacterium]|nr:FAD-dependent oxidoreductase [Limnochordia bacterium]